MPCSIFGDQKATAINHVKLLAGPFKDAQIRDEQYLESLNPDRLLANFRLTAGLVPKAESYKGWEERELRGHFTGHYLSACSRLNESSIYWKINKFKKSD